MDKIPVLLQLYTIFDDLKHDYFGAMERTREMGYDGVEYPGYFGGHDAAKIREHAEALGLTAVSSHIDFETMSAKTQETIEFCEQLGCRYVVIPWLDVSCLPGGARFPEYREKIISVAAQLKQRGMELLYHNHNFEFETIDGRYIFDELYDQIPADALQLQLDTCWVRVGGADPAAYIKKYAGRVPMVHLKDFAANRETSGAKLFELLGEGEAEKDREDQSDIQFDFRPVGHGKMEFGPIIEAARASGVKYLVVEQDRSSQRPALEAAKLSIDYLRGIGV